MCCFFNSCRRRRNGCNFSSWRRCFNRCSNRNSYDWSENGCGQSSFFDAVSADNNQSGCCCQQTASCCQ